MKKVKRGKLNWKPVVGLGILLWLLIFVEISVVMFMPVLAGMETVQKVIHLALLPVLVLICGRIYFRKRKVKSAVRVGLFTGIVWLIIGTILDLIVTVPLFSGFELFMQWNLWLGYLEVLVFTIVSASIFNKK